MKVTAIIDDKVIKEAIKYSNASSVTQALKVALNVYISQEKLKHLGKMIKDNPLNFNFSAEKLRKTNRNI